ncbi:ribosome recycling factor [Laetiporus sulphureus 93-53]|uniref:Ribosome recycling factor n=1 Tax=Laetiporus sulphureus 93-53 TaxID=1314785 RepID=A0A165GIG5_9APHY|nr:ribosome recycling factor [Laetiporus sulphureus 93-53]KZT10393.1 ribosome recycling factor [Laetiporus sulphureus 93-53]
MSSRHLNHFARGLARTSPTASLCWQRPVSTSLIQQIRTYAAKRKGEKEPKGEKIKHTPIVSTDALIPGSQRIAAGEEYTKAEGKMKAILDKYRKDVAGLELRASGRVTPAILSPVRVVLPDHDNADSKGVRLEEIATVGVREGTTLLITVFEEHTLKYVEDALYEAKLPGVVPQKADARTIKIPMPKPTVEARQAMIATAQKQAEDARVQIRKQQQTSLKKGKYAKYSVEMDEFQSLTDKYSGEIDKVLAEAKKNTGSK